VRKIERGLKRGPEALGYETQFVDRVAGGAPDRGGIRGSLQCLAGLAYSAAVGMELSAAQRAGAGAGWGENPNVEAETLAGVKKKAKNEGRTIVFIDESGLNQRPHRCRTWAPRGQTPVLQYHFNWKMLSAIAGVTWWNFYFRLFPGAIRSRQIMEFLSHLLRHIPGKLLIVLGWTPRSSQPRGVGLCAAAERTFVAGVSSRSDSCGKSHPPKAMKVLPIY